MNKQHIALAAAVSGLIAAAVTMAPDATADHHKNKAMEKCYGVVKAGKNDCATKTTSCAGTSTVDGQGDAFIAMPKGLCDRLVGGSTSVKD